MAASNTAATPMAITRPRGRTGGVAKAVASAAIDEVVAGSDTVDRFDSAVLRGLDEGVVVAAVLVGVLRGELRDRLIDVVAGTEVGRDGDGVTGAGVGP